MKRSLAFAITALLFALIAILATPAHSATTAAPTQKLCLPSGSIVGYSTACPAGTTSTRKICPDGTQVAYSASCPAPVVVIDPTPVPTAPQPTRKLCLPSNTTVSYSSACPAGTTSTKKICPYGQVVAYTSSCPTTPPAPPPPPPPPPTPTWTFCAAEGDTCSIVGTATVRYGGSNQYGSAYFTRTVTGSIVCATGTWGDPLPGSTKHCETDGAIATGPTEATYRSCPGVYQPIPTQFACPAPSTGRWAVGTKLEVGGYAFKKYQGACCTGLIMLLTRVDPVLAADPLTTTKVWSGVYAEDVTNNFPISTPYWQHYEFRNNDFDLIPVVPAP